MKLSSANYLFKQGLKNIWTNRIMSFASFCILLVSLLMIGFSVLFTDNINLFIGSIEDKNEVVIFLKDDATDDDAEKMGISLKGINNIDSVTFYSKEDAFNDLKKNMTDADELFQYIGEESPLPDSYKVRVSDISLMSPTLMDINKLPNVDSVKAPTDFVSVLTGLKSFVTIASATLLLVLVIICFVIISNATRASVDIRKREIAIMKYVGATNTFIKTPFFVEGLIMGLVSGVVASIITWIAYIKLGQVLTADMTLLSIVGIKGFIPFDTIAFKTFACYILGGALVGAIGTVISTRKYVRV